MKSIEVIEHLMLLGLSTNQAKIYVALTLSGPNTVQQVSRNANVPRENVYRAIPAIFKIGLIKRSIGTPTILSATPLHDGCSLLLNRKRSELFEIGEFVKELHNAAITEKGDEQFQQDGNQFLLIPEVEVLKMEQLIAEKTKESIIGMVALSRLPTEAPRISIWKRRASRGVSCKILFNRIHERKDESKFIDQLTKLHFEIRYITSPLNFTFAVYDNKEIICDVSERSGYAVGHPRLWSNNPVLVGMKQYIFETLWDSSKETYNKSTLRKELSQLEC